MAAFFLLTAAAAKLRYDAGHEGAATTRHVFARTEGNAMTEISRRNLLAGTAAVAVTPLAGRLCPPTPPRRRSASRLPGFYRYKVGDIEMTVVTDGVKHAADRRRAS